MKLQNKILLLILVCYTLMNPFVRSQCIGTKQCKAKQKDENAGCYWATDAGTGLTVTVTFNEGDSPSGVNRAQVDIKQLLTAQLGAGALKTRGRWIYSADYGGTFNCLTKSSIGCEVEKKIQWQEADVSATTQPMQCSNVVSATSSNPGQCPDPADLQDWECHCEVFEPACATVDANLVFIEAQNSNSEVVSSNLNDVNLASFMVDTSLPKILAVVKYQLKDNALNIVQNFEVAITINACLNTMTPMNALGAEKVYYITTQDADPMISNFWAVLDLATALISTTGPSCGITWALQNLDGSTPLASDAVMVANQIRVDATQVKKHQLRIYATEATHTQIQEITIYVQCELNLQQKYSQTSPLNLGIYQQNEGGGFIVIPTFTDYLSNGLTCATMSTLHQQILPDGSAVDTPGLWPQQTPNSILFTGYTGGLYITRIQFRYKKHPDFALTWVASYYTFRICGNEKVITQTNVQTTFLYIKNGNTYQFDIATLFTSNIPDCPVTSYSFSNVQGIPNTQVTLTGTVLSVDTTGSDPQVSVKVSSNSATPVSNTSYIIYNFCSGETINTVSPDPLSYFFDVSNQTTSPAPVALEPLFKVISSISLCEAISFELEEQITPGIFTQYSGNEFSIVNKELLFNLGPQNIKRTIFITATTMGSITSRKTLSIHKCGSENAAPLSNNDLVFDLIIGTSQFEQKLNFQNRKKLFSQSTPDLLKCPIVSVSLVKDLQGTQLEPPSPELQSIFYNNATDEVVILNNQDHDASFTVYLECLTQGNTKTYKTIKYNSKKVIINFPPDFAIPIYPIFIKVNQTELEKEGGLLEPIYIYTSPQTQDANNDTVSVLFEIPQFRCQCVDVRLNDNGTSYTIKINMQSITIEDRGIHILKLYLNDGKVKVLKEQIISISYIEEVVLELLKAPVIQNFTKKFVPEFKFDYQENIDNKTSPDPEPITVWIQEITRNGTVEIDFNQNLTVPTLAQEYLNSTKSAFNNSRKLSAEIKRKFEEVFNLSSILDVKLIINSELERDLFDFNLELIDWNETMMILYLNFTNPLVISSGNMPDSIACSIKNTSVFFNNETGMTLAVNNTKMYQDIPKQLPRGFSQQNLESTAKASQAALNSFAVVQIISQICMKGSLDDLMSLYFAMQMCCYLNIMQTPLPASAQIYNNEFIKMIEFDILNPEGIIQIFNSDFNLQEFISNAKKGNLSDENSIFGRFTTYIFMLILFIVILMLIAPCIFVKKLRLKISQLFKDLKQKLQYNLTISSLTIVYMKILVSAAYILITQFKKGGEFGTLNNIVAFFMIFFLVLANLIIYLILRRKQKYIRNRNKKWSTKMDQFRLKFSYLINEIHLYRNKNNLFFYPVSLLRKQIFISIAILACNKDWLQIQLLVFTNSLYLIYYGSHLPHQTQARLFQEITNECFIMTCFYHLFLFSQATFVSDETKFFLGFSFIATIVFMIFFNLLFMIFNSFRRAARRRQNKKNMQNLKLKLHQRVAFFKKLENPQEELKMHTLYDQADKCEEDLVKNIDQEVKKLPKKEKKLKQTKETTQLQGETTLSAELNAKKLSILLKLGLKPQINTSKPLGLKQVIQKRLRFRNNTKLQTVSEEEEQDNSINELKPPEKKKKVLWEESMHDLSISIQDSTKGVSLANSIEQTTKSKNIENSSWKKALEKNSSSLLGSPSVQPKFQRPMPNQNLFDDIEKDIKLDVGAKTKPLSLSEWADVFRNTSKQKVQRQEEQEQLPPPRIDYKLTKPSLPIQPTSFLDKKLVEKYQPQFQQNLESKYNIKLPEQQLDAGSKKSLEPAQPEPIAQIKKNIVQKQVDPYYYRDHYSYKNNDKFDKMLRDLEENNKKY